MSMKIGLIPAPPFVTQCAVSPNCSDRGFLVDSIILACQWMGTNCTFYWNSDNNYGDVINGTGTGLIGAIQQGIFDTSTPGMTPTFNRFTAITFSNIYDATEINLLTRAPPVDREDFDWNVVNAFPWSVWLLFFIMLFFAAFVITAENRFLSSDRTRCVSIVYFDACSSLIRRNFGFQFSRSIPTRILISLWLLSGVVLTSLYSSVLYSQHVIVNYKLPFSDLETFARCLETRRCRIVSWSSSTGTLQMLTSESHDLGFRISASIRRNPIKIVPLPEIRRAILEDREVYLVSIGAKDIHIALRGRDRECLFYNVDLGLQQYSTFPVRRGSPFLEKLNMAAVTFQAFGLQDAIKRKYPTQIYCDTKWTGSTTLAKETHSLYFVVIVVNFYLFGIFVSFALFALELILVR